MLMKAVRSAILLIPLLTGSNYSKYNAFSVAVQGQGSDFAKMGTADNDIHIGFGLKQEYGRLFFRLDCSFCPGCSHGHCLVREMESVSGTLKLI